MESLGLSIMELFSDVEERHQSRGQCDTERIRGKATQRLVCHSDECRNNLVLEKMGWELGMS